MPFAIIRQDITKMQVDAVVNAANTNLLMGGGVCGAIFRAAGAEKLQAACNEKAPIHTGDAAITDGFELPAKYIIHAAGPVYSRMHPRRSRLLLRAAYINSMRLAEDNGCTSIAFPLISSGIYGYPKREALETAREAIRDYLCYNSSLNVFLVIFDRASFAVSEKLIGRIESYIDDHYAGKHYMPRGGQVNYSIPIDKGEPPLYSYAPSASSAVRFVDEDKKSSLDEMLSELDEPFNTALMRIIDEKELTDSQVYRRANIDRRLFSKIRTGNGYSPGKKTVIALALALELSLSETDALLEKAGYALSHANKFDVIIEYFIINKKYDIFEINEVLFSYDLPILGSM